MFQVELQYDDIKGPTEIDMTRIPEFPASAALQSIAGQNLKGAAFDVLQAYADQARMADMRHEAAGAPLPDAPGVCGDKASRPSGCPTAPNASYWPTISLPLPKCS